MFIKTLDLMSSRVVEVGFKNNIFSLLKIMKAKNWHQPPESSLSY